jgi:hypothetical protein
MVALIVEQRHRLLALASDEIDRLVRFGAQLFHDRPRDCEQIVLAAHCLAERDQLERRSKGARRRALDDVSGFLQRPQQPEDPVALIPHPRRKLAGIQRFIGVNDHLKQFEGVEHGLHSVLLYF